MLFLDHQRSLILVTALNDQQWTTIRVMAMSAEAVREPRTLHNFRNDLPPPPRILLGFFGSKVLSFLLLPSGGWKGHPVVTPGQCFPDPGPLYSISYNHLR